MYSSEQEEEIVSENSGGFYQNNKVLVWVCIIIVLIAIAAFFLKQKFDNSVVNSETDYTVKIYPENEIEISIGNGYKLLAVVNNNPDAVVTWTSSDENIAKVDNGQVTSVSYGKATITATYIHSDNKKYEDSKIVTISEGKPDVLLTDVSIQDGNLLMPVNGTYTISLNMTPSNGYVTNKTFSSSNVNVVTVNNNGFVEAKGEGEATISININNGAFVRTLQVSVSNNYTNSAIVLNPSQITLSKEISKLKIGGSAKISYTITPQEASQSLVNWTSSDTSIINVDQNGIVSAIKEGKAIITATTVNGISDSVEIEVEPDLIAVTDIVLSLDDWFLEVGQTQTIIPIVIPSDATNKMLTFISSDPSIISIIPSSDGLSCTITPLAEGTATLTVSDSSGMISKTINITVVNTTQSSSGSGSGSSSCGKCKTTCESGKYCSCGKCVSCPAGNYCSGGKKIACPAGKGSVPNSSMPSDCTVCAKGYYSTGNGKGCVACPEGKTTKSIGSTKSSDCNIDVTPTATKCKLGYYLLNGKCSICKKNYYCPDGTTTRPCGVGKTTDGEGKTSINDCK